ncbi:class IIb bacteriocin, lactobin A/cerein 7B family [Flavobacterium sp. LPB0248]|uniref:class IIb bacteriocin, lactobin A/cerein 7B family n=1 Tax=Flavobacterium sp. LPB0248 TaxID=2614441 RepID=UPI0015A63C88|nr:class IIb bacteriocin, lactobin A/cerein 7B family [Flavobacterium sp. LPB0248]QLC66217.1 class IIb bacteriocin, lactobin A/cerein 7B family [Flavobacterium sp. LPB0248]
MDNLKNLNFTELNPSEMKQVRGGGLIDDILSILDIEALAKQLDITIEEARKILGL